MFAMLTPMRTTPVITSERCALHIPGAEIWVGVRTPGTEVAERAARIETTLRHAGYPVTADVHHSDDVLEQIHDPGLIRYLSPIR